jgi:fucose permease
MSVSSSWPLALAITILVTAVAVFGRKFVPEQWRRERPGLTNFIFVLGALTVVMIVIVVWSVLP